MTKIDSEYNEKLNKFTNNMIRNVNNYIEAEKMSYKELADFMIQKIWSKIPDGTKEIAVVDRVIAMLFKADEKMAEIKKNNCKPNKDINIPKYDKITEGYDPDKL